ncbi:MAG: VWA domain-containing protein [Candidatus Ozemobacteraceae bacterium]
MKKTAFMIMAFVLVLGISTGAWADQVKVTTAFGQPYMLSAAKQTNFLKIGLSGILDNTGRERTPVNVAIVLDKSGSMSGEKLRHAKEAAIMAIERLTGEDILSVIAYDSQVEVLVPATKVSDRLAISDSIRRIEAGSNTALFAGVSKGAKEVRKFLDRGRVNRIILLSDGMANEGPSSPHELGELGASLIREGISVTTFGLGLGYNEDLMAELARRSDGNHAFIETPQELTRIFNAELGDVLSVVAQEVKVEITFRNCRPVRLLGREGEIRDQTVVTTLNQLYGNQEKLILLEFESAGQMATPPLMDVRISYTNLKNKQTETFASQVGVQFSEKAEEISAKENRDVMISATHLIANDSYKVATRLRDEGKIEEAKKVLLSNMEYLNKRAAEYEAPELKKFAEQNDEDASNIKDEAVWNKTRKGMRKIQHTADNQQSY